MLQSFEINTYHKTAKMKNTSTKEIPFTFVLISNVLKLKICNILLPYFTSCKNKIIYNFLFFKKIYFLPKHYEVQKNIKKEIFNRNKMYSHVNLNKTQLINELGVKAKLFPLNL